MIASTHNNVRGGRARAAAIVSLLAVAACDGSSGGGVLTEGNGPNATRDAGFDAVSDARAPDGSSPGDGASPADGSSPADDASTLDAGPPQCDPSADLGAPSLVLATPDPDVLGGISSDELVIAWTSLTESGPAIHWAERATKGDAFGPAQTVDPKLGPFAQEPVALAGDGLRLLLVGEARDRVIELTRVARGAPFATEGTDFAGVNPGTTGDGPTPGIGPFASPAITPDFALWAFTRGDEGLTFARNVGGAWNLVPFPSGLLASGESPTKLAATGWSADGRTLFYWDVAKGVERAAWRDVSSMAFVSTKELGFVHQNAVPNTSCTSLYYSAPPESGDRLDIYMAPLE